MKLALVKWLPILVSQIGTIAMLANGYFEFLPHLVDLEDPRKGRAINHLLIDMVALLLCRHNRRRKYLSRHRTLVR